MQVVTACAVLHNICVGVGDELQVEDVAMEGDDPPPERDGGGEGSRSGAPWRAALTNAITPLEVAPQDHDYFALVNMMNMINIGMSLDRVTDSVLT